MKKSGQRDGQSLSEQQKEMSILSEVTTKCEASLILVNITQTNLTSESNARTRLRGETNFQFNFFFFYCLPVFFFFWENYKKNQYYHQPQQEYSNTMMETGVFPTREGCKYFCMVTTPIMLYRSST